MTPAGPAAAVQSAPASYAQEGLWLSEQLVRRDGLLNMAPCRRIGGPVDVTAMRNAVAALAARHETLRTTFTLAGGQLCQRVHPDLPPDFGVIDLAGRPGDVVRDCRDLARAESLRGFDLESGPLVRVRLYRLGPADHVLLIVVHHLLCDRWSIGTLFGDLGELYRSGATGTVPALDPLPRQYRDSAAAQRDMLRGDFLDELLAYWRSALDGGSPVLGLPPDRPRPPRRESLGGAVTCPLPPRLVAALDQLARRARVTPFMLYLTAFRILLWRHTGEPDQLIGTPVTDRDDPDLEDLVGFFVNMLVLRQPLGDGQATFWQLLAAEREAVLDAFSHRELPYARLVEALRPARGGSASPLFAVTFSYYAAAAAPQAWAGAEITPFPLDVPVTQFDLGLDIVREADAATAVWTFDDGCYLPETMARLAERLPVLLEAIAEDPGRPAGDLPVLSAADAAQLRELRPGQQPRPGAGLVTQLFDRWAARLPGSVAVRQGSQVRSYAETARLSQAIAARLAGLGLPAEGRVGLLLRRSADLPAVILGVLRAGLAAVPLDPDHPADRTAAILADAGAGLVIRDDALTPAPAGRAALCLSDFSEAGEDPVVPPAAVDGASLAYVLYTSGSTGTPKGVEVTHGSLANCLAATGEALGYRPGQRWVAVSRTAFDISLLEILTPLACGGEVIISTEQESTDGTLLSALIDSCEADYLQATPGRWQMLYDSGWSGRASLTALTGGDVVSPELARRLIADCSAFWHTYGPTEATLYCVSTPLTQADGTGPLPLGRPIRNISVQLLDDSLRPVPPGAIGELCVGGAGLARGYAGRPDLTAERFVPDPRAARPGDRLYRTGDLAILRPDGRLELHGRNDRQVKLRGFRIELGEIESVLASHPEVGAAVVLRAGHSPESYRLVAYLQAGDSACVAAVRDLARRRLPAYMLPSSYLVVPAIPVTENGKTDREALMRMDAGARPGRALAARLPRTELELAIADIWIALLGVPRVSLDDDFFALGGNSLLAVRLTSMLRERFGVEVSVWSLFDDPTLAALASEIEHAQPPGDAASPLVWLRGREPEPLLAVVHAVAGSLHEYRHVAAAMPAGVSMCGFCMRSADEQAASVADVAARYLDSMPAGWNPRRAVIGGWSLGGLIAYEIAAQTARRHGTAPPVLLIDTSVLAGREHALSQEELLDEFAADIEVMLGDPGTPLPRPLPELARHLGVPESDLSRRLAIRKACADMAARYRPPAYPGPVHLAASARLPASAVRAWRSVAPGLTITTIPGDHATVLLESGAQQLAGLLSGLDALRPAGAR